MAYIFSIVTSTIATFDSHTYQLTSVLHSLCEFRVVDREPGSLIYIRKKAFARDIQNSQAGHIPATQCDALDLESFLIMCYTFR